MRRLVNILILLTCCQLLTSCDVQKDVSFCGFTFGGGGNTYSAEPATISTSGGESSLVAGNADSPVYLHLTWNTPTDGTRKAIELSEASVSIKNKASDTLLEKGHIVLQTVDQEIVHGSFELNTKSSDGRVFPVVGSFTAKREQ